MDTASQILYNGFPRSVAASKNGEMRQFYIHSEKSFDSFFKKVRPDKNVYCSTCRFRSDMRPVLSSIFFDFDSAKKDSAFSNVSSDRMKIQRMREDSDLLHHVLGSVWEDVESIVQYADEEGIPTLTVFSGLGFHTYLLYEEEVNPVRKKVSTSNMLVDECDLDTHDRKVITDVRRILRVPNAQRIDTENGEAVSCGVWTIPLTTSDVLCMTLDEVFKESTSPRKIDYSEKYDMGNRPSMNLYEDYEKTDLENAPVKEVESRDISSEVDSYAEMIVDNAIHMPCVRERIKQSNPDHHIRLNFAIHMLNAGFSVNEIVEVARGLNWIDFKSDLTRKFVKQAKKKRYSEYSCSTMMKRGFCTRTDDPESCETYSWTSGETKF